VQTLSPTACASAANAVVEVLIYLQNMKLLLSTLYTNTCTLYEFPSVSIQYNYVFYLSLSYFLSALYVYIIMYIACVKFHITNK